MIQSKDHVLTVNVWWEPKSRRTEWVTCTVCNGSGKIQFCNFDYGSCDNCYGAGETIKHNITEPAPEIPKEFVDYIQRCYEEYCLGGLHKLQKEF